AARYQELSQEAVRQWQALQAARPRPDELDDEMEDPAKKDVKQPGLPDTNVEAFRELLYAKAGPFRAPEDSKQYFLAVVQEQLAQLEKERKELQAAKPEFPQAMGVCDGATIGDLPIHLRGSH